MADVEPKLDKFNAPSIDDLHLTIASLLPEGDVWNAKNIEGSVLYKVVHARAIYYYSVWGYIELVARELNINTTDLLLTDWEKSVGLPRGCRATESTTTADRKAQVISTLRRITTVTIEEMQQVLDDNFQDEKLVIKRATDEEFYFAYTFPISFANNPQFSRFIWIIDVYIPTKETFAYTFPIPFEGADVSKDEILCVLQPFKPVDVAITFNYVEDESLVV